MRESPSPDDLDGRTALLLLTDRSSASRALYVLPNREGVLSLSKNSEARPSLLRFAPDALPFSTGALDSVVLDIDSAVRRQRVRAAVVREARRSLKTGGTCVIAAANRRVPRDWRNWRGYHLVPPDRRWSSVLASDGGFAGSRAMFARLDRARMIELHVPSDKGDRRIMVLRRSTEPASRTFLDELIDRLRASVAKSRQSFRLERFLIRRIGKTTLIVASDDGCRYVVRVARTSIAADRGRRNFEALEMLQSTKLISDHMKTMVPRPHFAGTIDRYPFYVEESLAGNARDGYHGWPSEPGWEPGALRFISDMHAATMRRVLVDRTVLDRFVVVPLERIRRRCATSYTDGVIGRLGSSLERILMGEKLPFVWSHGDLSAGNCLYDAQRRLSAVVDWELFSDDHLPLLDVLNVMEIPGERNSHPTWQRFDTIRVMFSNGSVPAMPALTSYIERIDIPRRVLPALSVLYWVDHVAKRIDARGDDAVWIRKRVLQPLSSLASIELT